MTKVKPIDIDNKKCPLSMCELIIKSIYNQNPSCNYGMTPFHITAEFDYSEICQLISESIELT